MIKGKPDIVAGEIIRKLLPCDEKESSEFVFQAFDPSEFGSLKGAFLHNDTDPFGNVVNGNTIVFVVQQCVGKGAGEHGIIISVSRSGGGKDLC
jgi:hypothetical protein